MNINKSDNTFSSFSSTQSSWNSPLGAFIYPQGQLLPLPHRHPVYVTNNLKLYVVLHLSPTTTLFLRRLHSSLTRKLLFMLAYAPRGGRAAAERARCGRRSSNVPSRDEKKCKRKSNKLPLLK